LLPKGLDLSEFAKIAQVTGIFVAVGALGFAWAQIRQSRREARNRRAYDYFGHFHSDGFVAWVLRAIEIAEETPVNARGAVAADRRRRAPMVVLANFFTDLGTNYEHGLVNRALVEQLFGEISRGYFESMKWFIDVRRTDVKDEAMFIEWENMNYSFTKPWAWAQQQASTVQETGHDLPLPPRFRVS